MIPSWNGARACHITNSNHKLHLISKTWIQLKVPLRVACQQVPQTLRKTYTHFIKFHFVLNWITDGTITVTMTRQDYPKLLCDFPEFWGLFLKCCQEWFWVCASNEHVTFYIVSVACLALSHFSALFHKLQNNICVLIFSTTLVWNSFHFTKNLARYDKKCILVFM
jgi:hypothetical protein